MLSATPQTGGNGQGIENRIVFCSLQVTCQTTSLITHFILSWFDFLLSAQNLMILIFVVRNLLESFLNRGFSKYRLENSFNKFVLNHHHVLDIKYSMEEINDFIRSHLS